MTGVEANWYDVRRNMDLLPDFVNPETTSGYPEPLRARLAKWLDDRRTEDSAESERRSGRKLNAIPG